jgi:hypothetical protein
VGKPAAQNPWPEVDVALVVANQSGAWMKDALPPEMTRASGSLPERPWRLRRESLTSGQLTGQAAVSSALRYAFGK